MSIHFCLIRAIPRHVKLLMDALHIPYADIKDELTMYTGTNLIRKVLPHTLTPSQVARFLVEFNITNATIWSNLSFDQAKQLLKNLQNNAAELLEVK
jgi:precorrin-6B methylase 1